LSPHEVSVYHDTSNDSANVVGNYIRSKLP